MGLMPQIKEAERTLYGTTTEILLNIPCLHETPESIGEKLQQNREVSLNKAQKRFVTQTVSASSVLQDDVHRGWSTKKLPG